MAAAPELLKFFSRKRKAEQEFLGDQYRLKEEMAKKRFRREMEFETEASQPAVMSAIVITKSDRNERGPDELRNGNWWSDGYQNWDEESFKKRSLNLDPHGEIPFTTVGDSAFPNHSWLLKPYKDGTRVPKQRYFNRRLCSARVVSEHAYGMLKGRWRILYKKTECHLDNISLIIMTCIALHNLCIHRSDPCNPRWRLQVNELNLIRNGDAQADDGNTTREAVANWLWDIREERNAAP